MIPVRGNTAIAAAACGRGAARTSQMTEVPPRRLVAAAWVLPPTGIGTILGRRTLACDFLGLYQKKLKKK